MAKDKLIGNLNMNMIDVDYQGVETETASTTVDNNKRTIATEVKKVRFPLVFAINGEKVIYDGSESILISYDHFDSDLEAEIAQRKVAVGNEEARARAREHELESDAASFLDIVQDEQTGIVTIKLLNIRNEVLDTKTLDLETEKIIRTITLNYPAKKLIFTSVDGTAIECDIKDMINDFEAKLANLDTSLTNVLATESSRAVSEEGRIEAKAEDLVATEKNRAEDAESQLAADLTAHKADKANPHGVTKAQVGLGNADNTSDIDKPVSTAQQAALDLKLDKDNFGWAIADHTYNPEFGYTAGDTVYYVDVDNPHRGYLYVAKEDIAAPAGDFDYTKWNTTTLERLIWYKQDKINDNNKLFADYVDDSNAVHKFATSEQLTQIATNATDISNHKADNANPHNVTKAQVGLGDVVNTGDSATPVENGTTKFTTGGAYTLKTNLENQIETIEARSDVVDVVACYDYNSYEEPKPTSDIVHYDTTGGKISNNDVVKVLIDETHNDAVAYYRWVVTSGVGAWTYIGSVEAYYTKAETDAIELALQNQIDKDIEVINYSDYGTTTALSDELVAKAIAGKVAIYDSSSGGEVYLLGNAWSGGLTFRNIYSFSTSSGSLVPATLNIYNHQITLNLNTKKFSDSSNIQSVIRYHSDNFIDNTVTPDVSGKQLIRALNLRKTQDMIADVYDSNATYSVGDYIIYQNELYRCKTAVTVAEAFDSTKWDKVQAAEVNNEDKIEVVA